jgi:hypothetical protein
MIRIWGAAAVQSNNPRDSLRSSTPIGLNRSSVMMRAVRLSPWLPEQVGNSQEELGTKHPISSRLKTATNGGTGADEIGTK